MLKFDEVVECKDVSELNLFIEQYLAERNITIPSEEANRYYWALVYRWKSSLKKG